MEASPYTPCSCGSGKSFKFCCQPIHKEIARVFELDEEGQHEAALNLMDQVIKQHPQNPEVHGRKAQLLFQNEKAEDAEKALDEAFKVNPNYAFGHFLKGRFRLFEGEIAGGLLLLRKAVELYSPEAHEVLGAIYVEIFDCEMKLNHPVAAHAAAELALKHNPSDEQLRAGIDQIFANDNPNLPPAARKRYEFKKLPAGAAADRKQAWDKALAAALTGKLKDAATAFEQVAQADEGNAAAWYNLGLCRAWLGHNAPAVEALEKYVAAESDAGEAAEGWTLAEVLRVGQGAEEQADYVEHSITIPVRDPQAFVGALGQLEKQKVLTGVQIDQERGVLAGIVLDPPPPALTPELEARQSPRLGAYLVLAGGLARMWHTSQEALGRAFDRLEPLARASFAAQPLATRGPCKFHDVVTEALAFPRNVTTDEEARQRMTEHVEKYFEDEWVHRPLKALAGSPPVDAAGHPTLRKKLAGTVQFVAECATLAHVPYDFARLRRKLGLAEGAAAPAAATTTAAGPDITAMSAAELSGLALESLDELQLEQAYQSAIKLDARELAGKFAHATLARPPHPERLDRYPLYNHLIQLALAQNDTTAALDHVNAGEQDDCKHNEGRRRNDYELRRAELHAKRGELDQAGDVFDRLIARAPDQLKYRAAATEAMVSARQGTRALRYAEAGLAEARKQQNRDVEGHLMELCEAAKRQGG